MKPKPTKVKRKHGVNDCFSDCIAFMLDIHPMNVPYFAGMKNYVLPTRKFLEKRGYEICPIPFMPEYLKGNKFYIIQGISHRKHEHVVIYKGKKPFYDPNVKGGFLKKNPHTYWKITKLPKKT